MYMGQRARKITTGEFAGSGCFVQGLGILLLFLFPIGTVIGILLFFVGSAMAVKRICSLCGNRVDSSSRMCPHCRATFK